MRKWSFLAVTLGFGALGVSVDNRKFCAIFGPKCTPKVSRRKPHFCSLFAPKLSHFCSKMVGSRYIFMFWRNFVPFGVENNLNLHREGHTQASGRHDDHRLLPFLDGDLLDVRDGGHDVLLSMKNYVFHDFR